MSCRVRQATLDDVDVLVRHRLAMFADMGVPFDAARLGAAFGAWLRTEMPGGTYRAWLAEEVAGRADAEAPAGGGGVVAGAGATIIPWPPGPQYPGDRLAFVYNVYTEPAHRRRGLARALMAAVHGWCREHGIGTIALNASPDGQPLYEALGYVVTPSPMMFFPLVGV